MRRNYNLTTPKLQSVRFVQGEETGSHPSNRDMEFACWAGGCSPDLVLRLLNIFSCLHNRNSLGSFRQPVVVEDRSIMHNRSALYSMLRVVCSSNYHTSLSKKLMPLCRLCHSTRQFSCQRSILLLWIHHQEQLLTCPPAEFVEIGIKSMQCLSHRQFPNEVVV